MLAALTGLAALVVALFGAAPADAKHPKTRHLHEASSARTGAGLVETQRARRRHRGIAHHAVSRHPGQRGKRLHGAHSQPTGPAAGPADDPAPVTAPGPPLPSFFATSWSSPQADAGAPAPPAAASSGQPAVKHGVEGEPESGSPPVGEPESPAGEPQEPPAEEPGTPPAEEPEPPAAEEPEPPAEEPEPPAAEEPEPPAEEPEPPSTEEPEVPAGPAPLFKGDAILDWAQVQAAKGAITEVPDPLGSGQTVFKMTVHDEDVAPVTPTENPRAQLVSPDLIEAGDEFWLKTKFLIPQDFPTVTGWMSMLSVYGPPFDASSPWQIELIGDHLQWMRNRTYGFDVPWQAPLTKGTWVTVLTHERLAADGFIEMWINGQPVSFFGRETRLEMKTMDDSNDGGANSIRIAQYRQAGMFETGTIYFGPVLLGASRDAVGG